MLGTWVLTGPLREYGHLRPLQVSPASTQFRNLNVRGWAACAWISERMLETSLLIECDGPRHVVPLQSWWARGARGPSWWRYLDGAWCYRLQTHQTARNRMQPAAAVAALAVECLFCRRANERFFNWIINLFCVHFALCSYVFASACVFARFFYIK